MYLSGQTLEHQPLHTAARQAEAHLAQGEELYRRIFETMVHGIFQLTPEGRFLMVNPGLVHMLGYASVEALLESSRDPACQLYVDASQRIELLRQLAEHGPVAGFELQLSRQDGQAIWVSISAHTVDGASGAARSYEGSATDITARKRAEEALHVSEAHYRRLFASARDGILLLDAQTGAITDVNPSFVELSGYAREDIVGRQLWNLAAVQGMAVAACQTAFAELQAQGYLYYEMLPLITRDGRTVAVEIAGDVYPVGGEGVMQWNMRDITARIQAEQEQVRLSAERDALLAQLQSGLEYLPLGFVMLAPDGTIQQWSLAAEGIFGYCRDEAVGQSLYGLVVAQALEPTVRQAMAQAQQCTATHQMTLQHVTRDGRAIWCEWSSTAQRDETGRLVDLVGMVQDITARVQAEEQLHMWAMVLEHSAEGIIICDARERILMVNDAFTRVTGYTRDAVLGHTPRLQQSGRHDRAFYQNMWKAILEAGAWQGEIWNRRQDGEIYPEWLTISAVRDAQGTISHYVGIFSDISERKRQEERLAHLAHYDALTDLPNRALLGDRLERALATARRYGSKVGVLCMDLDRFKNINDSLGHSVGDHLLQIVAARLRAVVRGDDTVARMGGDEFILLLANLHEAEDAGIVAKKLLDTVTAPYQIDGQELLLTMSLGIAVYPHDGGTVEELIRNADAAMYQAKDRGRDTYQFYTEDMNRRSLEKLSLENALRRALARGEFVLHYQPKVDVRSGQIVGAEALIRWQHPDMGMVSPGTFIPLAEDCGLIGPIGTWVMEEACRQVVAWQRDGLPAIPVAVNVAASQFWQRGFIQQVLATLDQTGVSPACLELEFTERVIMVETEETIALLHALHEAGLQLAIDDFGTGYSSLSYLRRFPIDVLKIDQSFIREIANDPSAASIVSGIIGLAKSLQLQVIAEGVETWEQLVILRAQRCDQVQGYLYSRAVPPEAFAALLRQGGTFPVHREQ